jgi:hypothetical protein
MILMCKRTRVYALNLKAFLANLEMFAELLGDEGLLTFDGCLAKSAKRARLIFLAYSKSLGLNINFDTI